MMCLNKKSHRNNHSGGTFYHALLVLRRVCYLLACGTISSKN